MDKNRWIEISRELDLIELGGGYYELLSIYGDSIKFTLEEYDGVVAAMVRLLSVKEER